MAFYSDAKVLVTGAAGTIGKEVVKQLLDQGASRILAIDNNESELFFLGESYRGESRVHAKLADIRDKDLMLSTFENIDYVIHAAAFKHVGLCETTPMSAVTTNILGVQNVIEASLKNNVKKCVFTSTDKAVNPTNVMGTTKLMGERLITANHTQYSKKTTRFCSVRFGNVSGSRGSVIPLFIKQIQEGNHITLTSNEMTRFMMTIKNAVSLVLRSQEISLGGELYITKMRALKIKDLAGCLIRMVAPYFGKKAGDIEVRIIGARPGEKEYEELMTSEEVRRSLEIMDFFVNLPYYWDIYPDNKGYYQAMGAKQVDKVYHSHHVDLMTHKEIESFLTQDSVLPDEIRTFVTANNR